MDAYNSIFEINFNKINQNCGNSPESYVLYVIANHAILRKFRTPKNLSEEGFQLFSCLVG